MQSYELTVVLAGSLDEKRRGTIIDRVKKLVGEAGEKVEKEDEWGKRQLAYPIKKQKEGVYHLFYLSLDTDKIGALNRVLQNDEEILRHMVVRGTGSTKSTKSMGGIESMEGTRGEKEEKVKEDSTKPRAQRKRVSAKKKSS